MTALAAAIDSAFAWARVTPGAAVYATLAIACGFLLLATLRFLRDLAPPKE